MEIRKSDNTVEDYSEDKIRKGVYAAFKSAGEECNEYKVSYILGSLSIYDNITSAEIRKQVEAALMSISKPAAKAYIQTYDKKTAEEVFVAKKKDFIEQYIAASNPATGSKYDSNANVSMKNVVTMGQELYKFENIKQNRKMLFDRIAKLYSKKLAKQYIEDLESHVLYKHDETAIPGVPYCIAITMYPFLIDGLTKLGGISTAPTDLKSYCGEFINLVYSISSQFAGACMYKDQVILIKKDGISYFKTAKDLVNEYLTDSPSTFSNYQGNWQYNTCSGLQILENGRLVDITKVYKRNYSDKIYKISTKDGHTAMVSKDHIFKQLLLGRYLDIKAEQLKEGDTILINKDYTPIVNQDTSDYKKGWIIGMLCGDGSISEENCIKLSVNYEQEFLADIFNEYSKEIFGYELNKNKGHKCWNYAKRNKEFYEAVHKEIIGTNTYDKHINIEDKSLDYLTGFLDGLFCSDGSYTETHGIAITLTNKDLSKNIQDISKLFGLQNNISTVKPRGERKESYNQYVSSRILKYLKHIHLKMRKKGIPSVSDYTRELYYYGRHSLVENISSGNKKKCWSNYKKEDRPEGKYITTTDVIESIEILDNDDNYVYEIETSSHWYNCGGFITHNCATPEFLLCMDYFIRKDFGENYLDRLDEIVEKNTKQRTLEKVIENYFQQVVHSMNMPAGNRGYQTVFWNVGYFDKNYFDGVFGEFTFPDGSKPNWTTLNWLQKKFMKWFNKEREKYILTFPVETMAMLTDGHDVVDKEYADFTSEMWSEGHSFFVYLSDSADSLSSCCFDKDTRIMYSVLGSEFYEKAVPIKDAYEKHKDETIEVLEYNPYTKTRQWTKAKFVKAESSDLYKFTFDGRADWTTITATHDHIFPVSTPEGYKDIKAEDIKVGDKLIADKAVWTLCEEDFEELIEIEVKSIEKVSEKQEVYCIKMENEDSPYFVLANGIVSHNCRLRNSIKDMEDEHNHTQHQFSMGTASVATGSKSVMTINLNRVIQNAIYKNYPDVTKGQVFSLKDHPEAYEYILAEITDITERVHKYQIAFNSIIKDFFESRMLPVYDAGFITLNKQYLTVGVNGLTDAAEFLGLEINDNEDYRKLVNNVLETINIINKKDKTREHMFNTEFVPGENLSVKNYRWDKTDGYFVSDKHDMYSSYFFNPEDTSLSVLDKMKLHGTEYVQFLDGGSACHINISEHMHKEQYRKLLEIASEFGTNYFTFNCRNTVCNDCGYISKDTLDTCPKCGSKNLDYLTRIIGYLKRVSSFSEPRQAEEHIRAYNKLDD
jgi:anaerobic ribonucleoside-triphosphate reductase